MSEVGKYGTVERFGEKLHPDEPWFTLRAQDLLAPYALQAYASLLHAAAFAARPKRDDGATVAELREAHARSDQLRADAHEVDQLASAMLVWQADHPELRKLPD